MLISWAYNSNKKLIGICDAIKEPNEKYRCINCNSELIVKNGKIRAAHFAHKIKVCNHETYLHKLAKLFFYNNYKKLIEEEKPFFIEVAQYKVCSL